MCVESYYGLISQLNMELSQTWENKCNIMQILRKITSISQCQYLYEFGWDYDKAFWGKNILLAEGNKARSWSNPSAVLSNKKFKVMVMERTIKLQKTIPVYNLLLWKFSFLIYSRLPWVMVPLAWVTWPRKKNVKQIITVI